MVNKEKLSKSKAGTKRQKMLASFEAARKLSAAGTAKWLDEEVASEAAKAIWETAHFEPCEQAEGMHSAGYGFYWRILPDNWLVADVANRILHDEEAAKELLFRDLQPAHEDLDVLAANLRKAKFVHFQITSAFNGGFDAYIVFRIPETARAIVVRLCK